MAEKQTATCSEHRQSFRNQSLTSRFHWFVWIAVVAYAMGHFATSEVNRSLPQKVSYRFRYQQGRSPYYGVTRKWDISDREWRHGRRFILTAWPWMVLHSIVGRAFAYSVPSVSDLDLLTTSSCCSPESFPSHIIITSCEADCSNFASVLDNVFREKRMCSVRKLSEKQLAVSLY
ncbi:uncharacterized protein LOC144134696 isoform X1 [Amblyomma americanum]